MKCWICKDGKGTLMSLPGFALPVFVCGNCILRALRIAGERNKR